MENELRGNDATTKQAVNGSSTADTTHTTRASNADNQADSVVKETTDDTPNSRTNHDAIQEVETVEAILEVDQAPSAAAESDSDEAQCAPPESDNDEALAATTEQNLPDPAPGPQSAGATKRDRLLDSYTAKLEAMSAKRRKVLGTSTCTNLASLQSSVPASAEEQPATRQSLDRMKVSMRGIAVQQDPLSRFIRAHNTAIVIGAFATMILAAGLVCYKEKSKSTLLLKTQQALQSQRFADAQNAAELGLRNFPTEGVFHFYRAQALFGLGNNSSALEEVTLAQEAGHRDIDVTALHAKLMMQFGRTKPGLDDYRQLIAADYGDKASNFAHKAILELMSDDAKSALADMNVAIQLQPRNVDFYRQRAQIYNQLKEFPKAIEDWTTVITASPYDPIACAARAGAEFRNKQTDKALADLATSLRIRPNSTAFYYRGLIHQDLNQATLATNDFTLALQQCDEKANATAPGETTSTEGADCSNLYHARANSEIEQGRYRQALDDYRKAIAKTPGDLDLHLRMAQCNEKVGDYSAAYDSYTSAIKIAPSRSDLYLKRAETSVKQHKYDLANHDFETAINKSPKTIAAYISRGIAYADQKLYDDAFSDFNHALRLEPNNTTAREHLAIVSKIKHSNIIASQPAAVALQQLPPPTLSGDAVGVGYQLMVKGALPGAISNFVAAVKKDPNNIEARRYLAHCLATAGEPGEAIEQFKVLASLGGLDNIDDVTFAHVCEQTGDARTSASLYQKLMLANPGNNGFRLSLAKAYANMGQQQQVQKICSIGIRLARSDDEIAEFNRLLHPEQTSPSTGEASTAVTTTSGTSTRPPVAASTAPSSTATPMGTATPGIEMGGAPRQLPIAAPKPVGNNQSINAWDGFKGIQKK